MAAQSRLAELDGPADLARAAFAQSVIRGLSDQPRSLSCRYLYDEAGSVIFERITEQHEYYPTRTEAGILARKSGRIRELAGATTLVELGAGSATKTRHLLRAWSAKQRKPRYVAIDISSTMLAEACGSLQSEFPSIDVRGVPGSYEQAFPLLKGFSPLTLLFLGSSVGNFNAAELEEFFDLLTANLADGDQLLLGIDLVKDVATLEAAYNDAAGWSAAFTLNLFSRMNRELGTDLDIDAIEHVAYWNEARSRIEIYARFLREASVDLPDWGQSFRIAAGEMVLVEISRKFEASRMLAIAARHGLESVETFTDPDEAFALLLLRHRVPGGQEARRVWHRRELEAQRLRTLELVAPLDARQLSAQHCPILSPVVWDLGHIAIFESQWMSTAAGEDSDGTVLATEARLYDPVLHPRPVRGSLPLAEPSVCLETLAAVRDRTLDVLATTAFATEDPLLADGYVFSMIAQHEAQHSETILQGIELLDHLVYEPSRRQDPPAAIDALRTGEVSIPGGSFVMGTDDRKDAYDNERPAHSVELPAFWIDVAPVTNAEYLLFMEDGSYRRRDLWTANGWLWLRETTLGLKREAPPYSARQTDGHCPAQWSRGPGGDWYEHAFGRVAPLRRDRPVVHVCWYEASAYARWAGKRLPSEAEWEKAASWDLERGVARRFPWGDAEPTSAHANLDQRTFAPAAVGAYPAGRSYFGCHQMVGDVWEWTSSDFLPYPGFTAWPYPEYSQLHFGRAHKVLRGGSWATPAIAVRNTFRNWDLPQRRQIFAGLRCARD